MDSMEKLRKYALWFIVVAVLIATLVSFGESFYGLFLWASGHEVAGGLARAVWPLMIDLVILVGEAALFIGHHDHWKTRHKAWAWTVTFIALGVSTAANVGHVISTDWLTHLTAALPPLALFFIATVAFGVMKRVFDTRTETSQSETPKRVSISHTETPANVAVEETLVHPKEVEAQPLTSDADDFDATRFDIPVITPDMFIDTRRGMTQTQQRVKQLFESDNNITANKVAKALGIAWATADKLLKDEKRVRGIEV